MGQNINSIRVLGVFLLVIPLALAKPVLAAPKIKGCADPGWFSGKLATLGKDDDTVAYAKSSLGHDAARDARHALAKALTKKSGAEVLALPRVKATLNLKSYAREDYLAALPAAWALDLKSHRLVRSEQACGNVYVAVAITKAAAVRDAASAKDFPSHLASSIVGGVKIAELDKLRPETEPPEADAPAPKKAAAGPEETDGAPPKVASGPDLTALRLQKSLTLLDPKNLVESQFIAPMRSRLAHLQTAISTARQATAADRVPAKNKSEDEARHDEKWITALKAWREQEYISAFEMFLAFARDGDASAQFVTGYMYTEALGVKRDYKEAMEWLQRAATNGSGPAKMLIAMLYFSGKGVPQDHDEAFKWVKAATEDGWHCEAQLTMCQRTGQSAHE